MRRYEQRKEYIESLYDEYKIPNNFRIKGIMTSCKLKKINSITKEYTFKISYNNINYKLIYIINDTNLSYVEVFKDLIDGGQLRRYKFCLSRTKDNKTSDIEYNVWRKNMQYEYSAYRIYGYSKFSFDSLIFYKTCSHNFKLSYESKEGEYYTNPKFTFFTYYDNMSRNITKDVVELNKRRRIVNKIVNIQNEQVK